MAKPEQTFRVGAISASVFVNKTKDKASFRTVSLERRYKDGKQWKSSNSFSLKDVPVAIAVLQMAMNHLLVNESTESGE
ncbi:MAG: hypothetical protein IH991_17625 [Planctomycetes bacterium]|nr:hypothetical protein [Planctomycetota bacterium]